MLRTHDGERVFDAQDVFVLIKLDEIQVMLDTYGLRRKALTMAAPRSASERHVRDFGHKLGFGCCRDQITARRRPRDAS